MESRVGRKNQRECSLEHEELIGIERPFSGWFLGDMEWSDILADLISLVQAMVPKANASWPAWSLSLQTRPKSS